ncbi:hypothetical protein MBLNU13_g00789t1 [Cladosporium sp. NU13]
MSSGRGLRLVAQIVKKQGGTVHVRSNKGQGTNVKVSLPLQSLSSTPSTQSRTNPLVRDATESPSRAVLITKSAVPPPPPAPILLLRGDFKWRFGGELEKSTSPPWSWMSEELCGKPYPYIARDFNIPASYTIRLNLSSPVAFDSLRTTQLRALDGWLSEESYRCFESWQSTFITNALPFVYTQNFSASVDLRRATALVAESLSIMELHKPDLQWYMEAYRLEGSLQLHRIPQENIELPSIGQCQTSTSNPTLHRSPTDPHSLRKRALSNSFQMPRLKTVSPSPSISPTMPFKKRKSPSSDSHG